METPLSPIDLKKRNRRIIIRVLIIILIISLFTNGIVIYIYKKEKAKVKTAYIIEKPLKSTDRIYLDKMNDQKFRCGFVTYCRNNNISLTNKY